MTTSVSREGDPDRFEITQDDRAAGIARFVDRDGRRVFFHTEVGDEFAGQGLAGQLVEEAVRATREDGLTIVPVCSYVETWLGKHPEHGASVAPPTDADRAAADG